MEITYHTDFGLRVLMYAGAHGGRRVTMREISDAFDISREHLRKVVHRLARAGYLATLKGRSGGLALARPPADIRVGDVVTDMEGSMAIVDCGRQPCRLAGNCMLKAVFDSGREAFVARLNSYTLEDLLGDGRTHRALHRLVPAA